MKYNDYQYQKQELETRFGITPIKVNNIDNLKLLNSYILVKQITDMSKIGNIYVPENLIYDVKHINRISQVVKAPYELYPCAHLRWYTENEIEAGDIIYHDYLTFTNGQIIEFKEELYRMIPYESVYMIKRGDEIIIPNGYVIAQEIILEQKYLEYKVKRIIPQLAKIKYFGKPVKYLNEELNASNDINFSVGDIVILNGNPTCYYKDQQTGEIKMRRIYLEDVLHKTLPDRYFRIKRNEIYAILETETLEIKN